MDIGFIKPHFAQRCCDDGFEPKLAVHGSLHAVCFGMPRLFRRRRLLARDRSLPRRGPCTSLVRGSLLLIGFRGGRLITGLVRRWFRAGGGFRGGGGVCCYLHLSRTTNIRSFCTSVHSSGGSQVWSFHGDITAVLDTEWRWMYVLLSCAEVCWLVVDHALTKQRNHI